MRLLAAAFAILTIYLPTALHAESFTWKKRSTVSVTVPAGWTVRVQGSGKNEFHLKAGPQAGRAVSAQITLIPSKQTLKVEELKGTLKAVTSPFVKSSVEKVFDPKPLALSQGSGFMVDLTDASRVGKVQKPGNYKVLRSAVAYLNDHVILVATILFDDPAQADVEKAMALVSSLHLEPLATAGQASSAKPAPQGASTSTVRR